MIATKSTVARFLLCLVPFFIVSSDAVAKVKTFPAKGSDISTYETYHWASVRILTKQGVLENDPDVAPKIKTAVNDQLVKKGYREVATGGQLEVRVMGLSEASNQLEGVLIGWGWEPGWGWAPTTASAISQVNRNGTLALALVDVQTKKPVWSGFATEALEKLEEIEKTINKAASHLFKKLPAKR
jgi:Domain of unknown function (DUF4136)